MKGVIFGFYQISYHGRTYYILEPENMEQFWVIHNKDEGSNWASTDFYGNRRGIEGFKNACGAMAGDAPFIVYVPCRKNKETCPIFSFFNMESWYAQAVEEYLDLVLMKPGTLKISDWKGIRACVAKTRAEKRRLHPEYTMRNRKVKEKYSYRSERKETIRFDTLFYNYPHYEYLELAFMIEEFLNEDREGEFSEDIRRDDRILRGDTILYLNGRNEVWLSFWDNDIFRKNVNCCKHEEGKI